SPDNGDFRLVTDFYCHLLPLNANPIPVLRSSRWTQARVHCTLHPRYWEWSVESYLLPGSLHLGPVLCSSALAQRHNFCQKLPVYRPLSFRLYRFYSLRARNKACPGRLLWQIWSGSPQLSVRADVPLFSRLLCRPGSVRPAEREKASRSRHTSR